VSDVPEGFKITEIGVIPDRWNCVELGSHLEQSRDKNKNAKPYKVYTVSNIYGMILSDEFFDKKVYSRDTSTYKIIADGYFAYNPYRINVGSLGLFKESEKGLVSPAYVVFKVADDALHEEFLFNLLKTPKYASEISRYAMARGSVRRSLSYRDLSKFLIPLPPLPEQKKIATVLSAVQDAKEKTEAVIQAARELKKSLMKHLFTYGPVSPEDAEDVPLKETEIGMVPEEWEVYRLGDIATSQYGYTASAQRDNVGPKFLRITDIDEYGNVNWAEVPYCSISPDDYRKFAVKDYDILVARIGATTGKACIIRDAPECVFASYLILRQ